MAKWLELNNGDFVNLDKVWGICKYDHVYGHGRGRDKYYVRYLLRGCYMSEWYISEEERNERFKEIKAMLIEKFEVIS